MDKDEFLTIKAVAANESDKDSKGSAKVTGVAYAGGSFKQYWDWRPMVLDLSGLEFAAQIPLMDGHLNSTQTKLGEINPQVKNNNLFIEGAITSQSEEAKRIIEDGKKSDWQLSMGADPIQKLNVEAGENIVVNGQKFTGPIVVVTKAKLREVSVVAIGAADETNMKIAAQFNLSAILTGEGKMTKEERSRNNIANQSNQRNQVGAIQAGDDRKP